MPMWVIRVGSLHLLLNAGSKVSSFACDRVVISRPPPCCNHSVTGAFHFVSLHYSASFSSRESSAIFISLLWILRLALFIPIAAFRS